MAMAKRTAEEQNEQEETRYPVKEALNNPSMQQMIQKRLGAKAPQFIGSLLYMVNNDDYLAGCEPMSIIQSALQAANFDLPIDGNLGFAYIVPYYDDKNNVRKAQFQIGYRGLVQLAQRSGQYKHLNAMPVFEGQLVSFDPLTEELILNFDARQGDAVVGYVAYFELINGFRKTIYWTKEQVEAHRIKHNKVKRGEPKDKMSSAWLKNYDAMAQKTVLRNLLTKWGILSIEMQSAADADEKNELSEFNVTPLPDDKNMAIDMGVGDDFTLDAETGEVLMDGMTHAEADALLAQEETEDML